MAGAKNEKTKPSTNGSTKDSKGMNGVKGMNAVKGVNGVNVINGNAVASRPKTVQPKKKSFFAWGFNIIARLLTWYSIYTLLFRCPSSIDECTDTTPKICKPYFRIKSTVLPHVTPYYDTYAAPYVDVAKPYYDTVDRVVITPSRTYAVKYGGPRYVQAKAFSQAKWEKNVQPKVSQYQAIAKAQYDQAVAPHVETFSAAVAPYYDIAQTNALQTYHEFLLPAYLYAQPYAEKGYDAAYTFTADTAVPTTVWAWNKTYAFLDATIWPHLRDVYVLKVEPQLVRIGERLGRYKEKKISSVTEEASSSTAKSTFAKPTTSTSTSTVAQSTVESETSSSVVAQSETQEPAAEINVEQKSKTPEEVREQTAKAVAEDLKVWEDKFTKAVEDGATEIEDRVDEISARMIENHAKKMGKSLVKQLDETSTAELENLKKNIVSIIEKHGEDAEKRDEALAAAVRATGLKIRDKAKDIRTWHQNYDRETEIAVTKAAQEHYDLLQETRDLALQKLGMKWAWMEGVTYKDWKKYHELKAHFDEWTEEFKQLITTHPGLVKAQEAGTEIESEGMVIAQTAAEELSRIKQIATWKAIAGDASDNFDSETTELAAIAAAQKVASAAQSVTSAVSSAATEVESSVESVGEAISEQVLPASAETVTVSLSQADVEDHDTSALPPMESLASEPTESATDLESAVTGTHAATNSADPIEPLPSSDPVDGPEQVEETIIESPDEPTVPVEEATTTTIKSALFGAAAQSVPSRQPIMDDDVVSSASSVLSVVQSDAPASITSAAQSAYTAAIAGAADHYSRAMSAVSVQIHGEPKPIHEEMLSSVSSAYFGAVGSANSRLNSALSAASEGIQGTTTTGWVPSLPTMPSVSIPTIPSVDWEKVQSIAQQNLDDSVNWASEQYESAKVAVGVAEPTPSTYLESAEKRASKALDQAKHNYYAGLGLAHARYTEFLSAASTAVSSLTATPTPTNIQESASSVASVASESAASAASVASEGAESLASSVGDFASDATDYIGENWDSLVNRVSSQVYGAPTPTPWYENLYAAATDVASVAGDYASAAGDYAASATDAAADQASSATALAEDYAVQAGDAAASQYSIVSSIVSELIVGKEPTFSESVYSRLAGAYTTGISSASSLASAASATVVSVASEASDTASSAVDAATDAVKETVQHVKDEL